MACEKKKWIKPEMDRLTIVYATPFQRVLAKGIKCRKGYAAVYTITVRQDKIYRKLFSS